MSRITVVIEDHAEGVRLGMPLAGGRVVAAMQGDHGEALEALECVVSCWEKGDDVFGGIQQARAAIAKARGH